MGRRGIQQTPNCHYSVIPFVMGWSKAKGSVQRKPYFPSADPPTPIYTYSAWHHRCPCLVGLSTWRGKITETTEIGRQKEEISD